MKVVPGNPAGHALGWCICRGTAAQPGGTTGTTAVFFVKAVFAWHPAGAMTLDTAPPAVPTGDQPHDDATHGLRYPSDFVPRKPFGEVMVVGTAHPPAGGFALTRYPVRAAVGEWSKQLEVFGEVGQDQPTLSARIKVCREVL